MAPWNLHRHQRGPNSRPSHHDPATALTPFLETSSPGPALNGPAVVCSAPHGADKSSSTGYHSSPSRYRPSFHVRSLSNPFPYLFSGKRKKDTRSDPVIEVFSNSDFPYEDVDLLWYSDGTGLIEEAAQADMKEFASGNCMTCGSTMRWPKELDVFKCSICVTINDLKPLGAQKARERRPQVQNENAPKIPNQPVSASHARRIVRQCLHTYLLKQSWARQQQDVTQVGRAETEQSGPANVTLGHQHGRQDGYHSSGSSPGADKYTPQFVFNEQPTLRPGPLRGLQSGPGYPSPLPSQGPYRAVTWDSPTTSRNAAPSKPRPISKVIFKPLEDYVVDCFSSFDRINDAFFARRTRHPGRSRSEYEIRTDMLPQHSRQRSHHAPRMSSLVSSPVCPVDPKVLLLGDFAENGTWWAGSQDEVPATQPTMAIRSRENTTSLVSQRSPDIHWGEVMEWYSVILNAAQDWFGVHEELLQRPDYNASTEPALQAAERKLLEAQSHVHRVLLKATETLLRRIGGQIKEPAHIRFLLILLENPLLHSNPKFFTGFLKPDENALETVHGAPRKDTGASKFGPLSGQHSGILKRLIGLISNAPDDCHNHLISWFSSYQSGRFGKLKDLIYGFLTYRLRRQTDRKQEPKVDITAGLIPELRSGPSEALLYEEIRASRGPQKPKDQPKSSTYRDDWQVKAATRVLSLIHIANSFQPLSRADEDGRFTGQRADTVTRKPFLPETDFYHSMIDLVDLVGDFDAWESRKGTFSFCQYPFLLSIWAKTKILEHDTHRQMNAIARDAFFDSVMRRRKTSQYLTLDVRRECLVDDSLKAVSQVIGSGSEDVKKALRISFRGEEGIDGGGLRKEWFLLLAREVFNPTHGLFLYDEDSLCCYFNPYALETSDQFYLVGVVMGLAIYNSTILDIALPPFAFRKLLAAAPVNRGRSTMDSRQVLRHTLDDLKEYKPALAQGLQELLTYEGDVEDLGLDFTVTMDKYGAAVQVPLCKNGESVAVTNSNRRDYVDLYVHYMLDTAVARQFEPFKRGFYTICGGNAFSLFQPAEIELLVRGSDETLDIQSLRANAEYDNWGTDNPDVAGSVVSWFWETFQEATPQDQRKMLSFITGSDRLPATGASIMPIKVSCLGEDCGRYPMARTCFNFLSLWNYPSKQRLEFYLWRAVHGSEGFGLK